MGCRLGAARATLPPGTWPKGVLWSVSPGPLHTKPVSEVCRALDEEPQARRRRPPKSSTRKARPQRLRRPPRHTSAATSDRAAAGKNKCRSCSQGGVAIHASAPACHRPLPYIARVGQEALNYNSIRICLHTNGAQGWARGTHRTYHKKAGAPPDNTCLRFRFEIKSQERLSE